MTIGDILRKRNTLFIAAIITGLIVGPGMRKVSWINIPILIAVMTVAALELQISHFRSFKTIIEAIFSGIILNLFTTGAIVIALGYLFFPAGMIRDGIVLAAACPPGLGIVPFTIVMGGSVAYSVRAFGTGYLFSVFLTPILAGLLIGRDTVSVADVTGVMWKLIVIPVILAFLISKAGLKNRVKSYYGPAVNVGFALMFAVLFGVNRHVFLYDKVQIVQLVLIFATSVFGMAVFIRAMLKRRGVSRPEGISILLSATVKNSLFASAIGLDLIGPRAALPGTVLTFVIIAYLMIVERIARGLSGPSNS